MWDMCFPSEPDSAQKALAFNHAPGGGNVLRLDGSVEFLPAEQWAGPNLPYRPADIEYDDPGDAQLYVEQFSEMFH